MKKVLLALLMVCGTASFASAAVQWPVESKAPQVRKCSCAPGVCGGSCSCGRTADPVRQAKSCGRGCSDCHCCGCQCKNNECSKSAPAKCAKSGGAKCRGSK